MTREQILITREDKKRLMRVLPRIGTEYADREDLVLLGEELERAVEVASYANVPAPVETMNCPSTVGAPRVLRSSSTPVVVRPPVVCAKPPAAVTVRVSSVRVTPLPTAKFV